MHPLLPDIEAITTTVMESMVGIVLQPAAVEIAPDRPALSGCVHIDGAWSGAALVECELPLARRMTAAVLALDESDVSVDDVRDALGEITNMVGGNLKGLVPAPSRLSLPTVVEGADYTVSVPGTTLVVVASFRTGDDILVVRVLEATDAAAVGS